MARNKIADYAVAGIRSEISKIGISFTDRELSTEKVGELLNRLDTLYADLEALEAVQKSL